MVKNRQNLIIISIVFVILAIVLYAKCGNMLIDFSRESYIPYQMLNGDKLCRDIFLIYGAFGYFVNMFLYKISLNINMLLIEASIIAYLITILFYFIVKKYTKPLLALVFTLFFIIVSVFSNSDFSFLVPYSYSTLWAILGVYIILFSYLYKRDKLRYITIGFIAINKIELFILVFVFSLVYDIFYKKINIKNYLLCLILPLIALIGFNLGDYISNSLYIKKMLSSKSLYSLYKSMGSVFGIEYFIYNAFYFVIYFVFGYISYLLYKKGCKILSFVPLLSLYIFIYPNVFFHLGFFISLILTLINRKKIKKRDLILLYFAIVLCSKSIFSINPILYSNFGYALMIFYIVRQLYLLFNKRWVLIQFFIFCAVLFSRQIYEYTFWHKVSFKTEIGALWLAKSDYNFLVDIKEYFRKNLKEDEKFIVIPEGQILNLIYKKPWGFLNSTFTPLDFEIFSDKYMVDKLKENKIDYIIFYPRDTLEYGAQGVCYDYGVDFCNFIADNYKRDAVFKNANNEVLIYKINEKK